MPDLISACMAFTGPLESCVLWPYRDNAAAGNATIGWGHLLYSPLYAANVLGVPLDTLQPQWDDLMKAECGKVAKFYETITDLRMTQAKADELFRSDTDCHVKNCQDYVPDFNVIPLPAQITCVDLDFNVRGGIRSFPSMLRAIAARDWAKVIKESNRPQLPARSKAVRELLSPLALVAVTTT